MIISLSASFLFMPLSNLTRLFFPHAPTYPHTCTEIRWSNYQLRNQRQSAMFGCITFEIYSHAQTFHQSHSGLFPRISHPIIPLNTDELLLGWLVHDLVLPPVPFSASLLVINHRTRAAVFHLFKFLPIFD